MVQIKLAQLFFINQIVPVPTQTHPLKDSVSVCTPAAAQTSRLPDVAATGSCAVTLRGALQRPASPGGNSLCWAAGAAALLPASKGASLEIIWHLYQLNSLCVWFNEF